MAWFPNRTITTNEQNPQVSNRVDQRYSSENERSEQQSKDRNGLRSKSSTAAIPGKKHLQPTSVTNRRRACA